GRPEAGLRGLSRNAGKRDPHGPTRDVHRRPAVLHLLRAVMVYEAAAGPRTPSCQHRPTLATARPRQWGGRELGGVRPGVLVPGQQPDGTTDALRGLVNSNASTREESTPRRHSPRLGMIHVHGVWYTPLPYGTVQSWLTPSARRRSCGIRCVVSASKSRRASAPSRARPAAPTCW